MANRILWMAVLRRKKNMICDILFSIIQNQKFRKQLFCFCNRYMLTHSFSNSKIYTVIPMNQTLLILTSWEYNHVQNRQSPCPQGTYILVKLHLQNDEERDFTGFMPLTSRMSDRNTSSQVYVSEN